MKDESNPPTKGAAPHPVETASLARAIAHPPAQPPTGISPIEDDLLAAAQAATATGAVE